MELEFNDQGVIVTGGTKGIGRGIASAFLKAGAEVIVCGREEPITLPEAGGKKAHFFVCDVRKPEDCDSLVQEAVNKFGRLDVLVNNAGGSPPAEAATVSPRFSEAIIKLNLLGPIYTSQAANTVMQEQDGGGVIVNIASVSGERPSPGTAAYGAAKAGLLNLTSSLAIEWAPKVRVTSLTLGLMATEKSLLHYGDEDALRRVAATVPLGRMGCAEDAALACLFLASSAAAYLSGSGMRLDGGGEVPAFLEAAKS